MFYITRYLYNRLYREVNKETVVKAIIFLFCMIFATAAMAANSRHIGRHALSATTLQVDENITVKLAGIFVPEDVAEQAKTRIETFANGKMLRLKNPDARADRYGRLPALVYGEDKQLLQSRMMVEGLAIWDGSENTSAYAKEWIAQEQQAEKLQLGLWQHVAELVTPDSLAEKMAGKFALVEGDVLEVTRRGARIYLNFGEDWRTDFTLVIEPKYQKNFDLSWLASLQRKKIRARGYVFLKSGAMIEIRSPEQIQPQEIQPKEQADGEIHP